VNKSSYSTM